MQKQSSFRRLRGGRQGDMLGEARDIHGRGLSYLIRNWRGIGAGDQITQPHRKVILLIPFDFR